jgi:hypothetical protein
VVTGTNGGWPISTEKERPSALITVDDDIYMYIYIDS